MKHPNPTPTSRARTALAVASLGLFICGWPMGESRAAAPAAPQELTDVAPDATPVIQQLRPAEAAPGAQVDVEIDGANFARDAYVSCSSPEVHVVKVKRSSATRIDVKLAIVGKAQPGAVTLYVTNPAGSVAQATFTIAGAPGAAAGASATSEPAAGQEQAISAAGSPVVTSVEPSSVTPGSQLIVKIRGKNFQPGARASFSNPAISVVGIKTEKSTQLAVQIQVASEAATGTGSVFVVNPDDTEVEARFDVSAGSPVVTATAPSQPAAPASAGSTTRPASGTAATSTGQQFKVYNLGDLKSVLGGSGGNNPQGTLSIAAGKLKYVEESKEVFSAARKDVKEIGVNSFLGVNTGTFHIILNSGKTYNFIASSFRPTDSQSIVEALVAALK